jgi:hypothetical protein
MGSDIFIGVIGFIISIISSTAFIWGPLLLGWFCFFLWHHYVEERFIGGIEWSVLEVHIPREMDKSPLAMQLFITNALYHKSGKGVWETYWQGAVHFWFSLEMASIDGRFHFFIRTPSRLKHLVETQLYAQYPQVKVEEVPDYTEVIPKYRHDGGWYLWGCDFTAEGDDALPIKTFADFGLDKLDLKEQYKIDPLTPTLEFLGSLQRGEQLWIQIIIRFTKKQYPGPHGHKVDFYDHSDIFLDEMLEMFKNKKLRDDGSEYMEIRVPDTIKDTVLAIKDKTSELAFDTVIRLVVLGDKNLVSAETFNNTRRASRLLFRQYTNPNENALIRINSTQYDSTWADPTGRLLEKMKHRHLTYYKLRTAFYPPLLMSFDFPAPLTWFFPSYRPKVFVLNTEELATIYHFPGLVSGSPAFKRIESKTAKPPANLPF